MNMNKKGSWILFGAITIFAIIYIFPVFITFISAFKSNGEILKSATALPSSLNFNNFIFLFKETNFPGGLRNSIFLTVVSETLIIGIIPMAAYALDRNRSKASGLIYIYFIAGMMIPFQAYMIPLFKELKMMHLFGNFTGPIFVYISGSTAFGTLLVTSFIKGVPRDIEESAAIDGCGNFMIFWRIVFPLLKPCIASLAILNGLGIWNDFLMPMLVLPADGAKTINVEIYSFMSEYVARWDVIFAGAVCGMIPVLIIFVLLQRYFVKGITTGAAKG